MQVGGTVADGDDVVVVVKMEIPVPSPDSATLTSLRGEIDDLVTKGQAIALVAS